VVENSSLDDILEADQWAREQAEKEIDILKLGFSKNSS
jgi:hypothetical protein